GFGILIPLLPTFAYNVLRVDETAIGIAIAVYSLTQFFFNPIFGNLSDKYGRRPLIVVSLLLNATGYVIFAFTDMYLVLIISRVIAGIGGSSIGVAQAYIADVTTKENRAKGMGLIGSAFGLGFVFGPLIGGYLSEFGYQVTGFVSAGFSFIAFLSTVFLLPESLTRDKMHEGHRKLFDIKAARDVFRNKAIGVSIVLFFILTFSVANMYGTFALLGSQTFGFTDRQNGYLYGVIGLSSVIVQGGLLNVFAKFMDDRKLIMFGSVCMIIGLGMIPYGGGFWGIAIIVAILSLGTGTLQPTILSLVSKFSKEHEQGMVLGTNQSISALGRVLGPLWGGFSFEFFGHQYPFLTGAFFSSLILIFSTIFLSKFLVHSHAAADKPKLEEL
ncbi:MAG: MFS transporter, partial [Syntrophothermus sp.]